MMDQSRSLGRPRDPGQALGQNGGPDMSGETTVRTFMSGMRRRAAALRLDPVLRSGYVQSSDVCGMIAGEAV
ncbi:MAG: hypothetical protein HYS63_09525 [Methylocystis sp.]|nr:hypothetical protein [Methylocystis sp.]